MEIIIYYKDQIINSKYVPAIGKSIMNLGLRIGDDFELFPFNHFDDENHDYKEIKLEHHTHLVVKDIKRSMIQTWNGSIKTKVEYFLDEFSK